MHGSDRLICSQIVIRKDIDYVFVYPMKKESHSFIESKDFGRKVRLPRSIKIDNARTEQDRGELHCAENIVSIQNTPNHILHGKIELNMPLEIYLLWSGDA